MSKSKNSHFKLDDRISISKLLDSNTSFRKIAKTIGAAGFFIMIVCGLIRAFSNKCLHCGKTIIDNGEYCSYCGKKIKG